MCGIFSVFVFVLLLGLLLLLGWLVFCFDFVGVCCCCLVGLFFVLILFLFFVFVCWLDGWLAFLLLLFCPVISQNSIIQLYCPSGKIHLRCGQCFLVVNNGIGACY